MCQETSRKQFSPLWRFSEARGCLVMCQERSLKAVLTAVEVLLSWCKPVYVPGKIERAVFTTVVVLSSSRSPVYVPGNIE